MSGLYQKDANPCKCGFSTEYPDCNGTHKVVRQLKEKIAKEIEAILPIEAGDATNMQKVALQIVRNA